MGHEHVEHLRFALNHLYDPAALRTSPLISWLGLAGRPNPALALQQELVQAIEDLKPADDYPGYSYRWRSYEVLLYRYVQQWAQKDVAQQLGMSERQVRREQSAALETLAYEMAQRFRLPSEAQSAAAVTEPAPAQPPSDLASAVERELGWLRDLPPEEPVSLTETVGSVLELVEPLADAHDITMTWNMPPELPALSVHPVALQQILLSLLRIAIQRSGSGHVTMSACPLGWDVQLDVQTASSDEVPVTQSDLAIVERLARSGGGSLAVKEQDGQFCAAVVLPAASQVPVLIVDDNLDTLHLFQRHLEGTRFRAVPTPDARNALALACEVAPALIILDIMMPDMDGLRLLARLRQHPATASVPIVVCTILPEEALALSLGAWAFLPKPFTREALLQTLDAQLARKG